MEISFPFIGILILYILLSINVGLNGELTQVITLVLVVSIIGIIIYTIWTLGIFSAIKYVLITIVISWLFPKSRFWTKSNREVYKEINKR